MIQYISDVTLADYKNILQQLKREYAQTKRRYFLARVVVATCLISVLITLGILAPSFTHMPSKWLYIPIIIAILFLMFFFKVSVKSSDNVFSNFLNTDYKSILKDIRHDIKTVTYYISCLEKGEKPDPVYAYISTE